MRAAFLRMPSGADERSAEFQQRALRFRERIDQGIEPQLEKVGERAQADGLGERGAICDYADEAAARFTGGTDDHILRRGAEVAMAGILRGGCYSRCWLDDRN